MERTGFCSMLALFIKTILYNYYTLFHQLFQIHQYRFFTDCLFYREIRFRYIEQKAAAVSLERRETDYPQIFVYLRAVIDYFKCG